jgi:hypothetical protein
MISRITFLVLSAIVVPAVAEVVGEHVEHSAALGAGDIEEPCFTMAATDRLEFEFVSNAELDFNLHYHEQGEVHFPVDIKQILKEEGIYIAPRQRTYCLMWTNSGVAQLDLNYQYQIIQQEESE